MSDEPHRYFEVTPARYLVHSGGISGDGSFPIENYMGVDQEFQSLYTAVRYIEDWKRLPLTEGLTYHSVDLFVCEWRHIETFAKATPR